MSLPDPTRPVAARAFASAFAALVADDDVIGTLTTLMRGCVEAVGAESSGLVVVAAEPERIELLASTSHRAAELELYQLQSGSGPCIEAVHTAAPVTVENAEVAARRWPPFGAALVASGYGAVQANPLRWHGDALGALNVFWAEATEVGEDERALIQGFADVATIVVLHAGWISPAHLVERTRTALTGRAVIEQAKGVLAYRDDLDMQRAFESLLAIADERGLPLSVAAAAVIDEASRRRPDRD